jgi:hypothetical protein
MVVDYFFAVSLVLVVVWWRLPIALLYWVAVVDCNCLPVALVYCFVSPVGGNQALHKALWPTNNNNCTAQKVSGFFQISFLPYSNPRP